MSRLLRIDYPDAWYHVMNRGRRGEDLFVDKADYQRFIDLLQETADLFNVKAIFQRPRNGWNWLYKDFVPRMLGSEKFITWIKDRFFKKKKDKEVPASRELAPDLDTIISELSRYYEIRPTTLKAVRRGIEDEPRDVAMYLIRSMRSEPLMRVGAGFGLNR